MKTKDFALEVKAVEEDGTFEGYASTFGGPADSYGEVVDPGAFADSLAQHRRDGTSPLMLWQHDPWTPIGVWDELAEDGKGLKAKGRLLKGVRQSEEALILLREKAIRGMSIGYREREVEEAKAGKPRRLKSVELLEASIVSFPANRRARVENVKSERMEELARRFRDGEPMPIKEFETVLRDAGFPKSAAVAIASHGYAKAIRGEPEGSKANEPAAFLEALLRG